MKNVHRFFFSFFCLVGFFSKNLFSVDQGGDSVAKEKQELYGIFNALVDGHATIMAKNIPDFDINPLHPERQHMRKIYQKAEFYCLENSDEVAYAVVRLGIARHVQKELGSDGDLEEAQKQFETAIGNAAVLNVTEASQEQQAYIKARNLLEELFEARNLLEKLLKESGKSTHELKNRRLRQHDLLINGNLCISGTISVPPLSINQEGSGGN